MWLTPAARRDVASALIEGLPEWPAPDMLSECEGSFVIMWDLGDEIAGTVVWDQMISVFWTGYQKAAETPGAAAEILLKRRHRNGVMRARQTG